MTWYSKHSCFRVIAVLTVCATFFFAGSATAQTKKDDLSGFWDLKIPTGDGNFRDTFFQLTQSGDSVTGEMIFFDRHIPISDGSFKDGKLHFTVTVGRPPRTRVITYDGTLSDGKINITSQTEGRPPVNGVAEPSKPEAALPPPRLPLPALHDVPDNGLARTPPMGWNSWNKFAGKVTDEVVRGVADAMVASGMKDAGYIYINIDDTWEGPRDANGNITSNTKFPDMKALADYVHSKGLKIGIYSSPGPKTCAGYEGSYGHEEQDAKTFAGWGIDYLKYDWCSAGRIYKDEDMRPVYQKMGNALLATKRPIVYSLCQYGHENVWTWGDKVSGNLWRTTGDISDNWGAMSRIGFKQFDIAEYAKPGHWNDPDMLEIGNGGMTADEYRTHMSLWSLLAAPLIAGNDLRDMSEETKSILMNREVIAIDQDPDGKPVKRISPEDATSVITVRPLHGGAYAVGLFNKGEQPQEISVKWADLGIGKAGKIRDLWKHQDVKPEKSDGDLVSVPTHGVVLLRVSAK